MLKNLRKITILLVLTLMIAALTVTAAAMGFSAGNNLPENQRGNGHTFFDLIVYPGQQQDLYVTITNTIEEEIAVSVEAITASTDLNGNINYNDNSGTMDETLKFAFADIAQPIAERVVIPPGERADVGLRLTVPNEHFDGAILGGLRVLREPTETEIEESGSIINQFAYVTTVRLVLSEGAEEILPADFILKDLSAELVHHRASIVAQIRNPVAKVIREALIEAQIIPVGGDQPIFSMVLPDISMAPNSIFPFTFIDEAGFGIEAGDYLARIELTYKGQTWNWEETFTIDETEAAVINQAAVNQYEPPQSGLFSGIPLWATIAAIVAVAAIILTIIIIAIKTSAKNKKQNAELTALLKQMQQPIYPQPQPQQIYMQPEPIYPQPQPQQIYMQPETIYQQPQQPIGFQQPQPTQAKHPQQKD